MDKAKPDCLEQSLLVDDCSQLLSTKNSSFAKMQNSLVPYCNDTSDSSSDEIKTSDVNECRKKNLSSPRKRKKNLGRCISYKLFPDSKEEQFHGCYPTTSDGSIDINLLFNPHETAWSDSLTKRLNQFPSISDMQSNIENQLPEGERTLSDTEYEIDLSNLELMPALIKQKKKIIVSSDEDFDGDRPSVLTNVPDNASPCASTAKDEKNEDKFAKPKLQPKCRKFIFKPFSRLPDGTLSHDGDKTPVDIIIPEQLAASYGLYIWPCSPVMAWYIWLHQDKFIGKNVLELGSGTALPGLLCAKMGAKKVWLSDESSQKNILSNCSEAVKMNNLESNVSVIGLTWGDYTKNLIQFRNHDLDFVIGSDLFFDPKVFEPLIKTLSYLLNIKSEIEIYITVQERSTDWTLEEYLVKWNLCCDYIYPKEFLKGTGIDESDLIGGHTIFILRLFKR